MNEKSGRSALAASVSNWANGTKCVANRSFSRWKWAKPVPESRIGSAIYTFQVLPWSSKRLNIVSASFFRMKFLTGAFTENPEDVAAVQNDRLGNVWDGTSQNQWSNTPNA